MTTHLATLRAAAGGPRPVIPAGLIVFFNSGSAPSGWTRVSAADNRMIVAAGNTYSAGSSGGVWTTADLATDSAGSHGHSISLCGGASSGNGPDVGGVHSHAVTPLYKPSRQRVLLIRADSEISSGELPAHAAILADGAITGLSTVFNDDHFAFGGSAISALTGEKSAAVSSAGGHTHPGAGGGAGTPNLGCSHTADAQGAHTNHAPTLTVIESIKQVVLRALSSSAGFYLRGGMIGLWDGGSIPDGWTERTSFRDFFIKFHAAGEGTTSGNGTIHVSMSLASGGVSHTHGICGYSGKCNNDYSAAVANTHTHSVSAADRTYLPPYYALKLIQLTGQGG
jgi:hypothetical protein